MSYHFGIHDEKSVLKYKQTLEKMKVNKLDYRILIITTSKNYQSIEEMFKSLYQLGAKGIMITNYSL